MNRYKGAMVIFDGNVEESEARKICDAVMMIKGINIVNLSLTTSDDFIITVKNETEIIKRLRDFIRSFKLDKD